MTKKYRLWAGIAGLFVAGAIVVQARNANATFFQQDSTYWTERVSCPQLFGQDMCRGWGTSTRVFNPITGTFSTVKGVAAWRMTNASFGYTATAGLRSTGSIISGCTVQDTVYDLNPVTKTASACSAGVRTRVSAEY